LGFGAAGGVATGAAAIAKTVKDSAETERHNKEIERIKNSKQGDGITDVIKQFSKKTGLEKESRKLLKNVLYNIAEAVEIKETKDGFGLYLKPFK
jgi:hypothetical protein